MLSGMTALFRSGSIAAGSKYPHIVDVENYEISEYYVQYNPN